MLQEQIPSVSLTLKSINFIPFSLTISFLIHTLLYLFLFLFFILFIYSLCTFLYFISFIIFILFDLLCLIHHYKCDRSHRDARWIGGLSHQSSKLSHLCYLLQKVVVHACSDTRFEWHMVVNYLASLQTT